jgi:hypothetical protein
MDDDKTRQAAGIAVTLSTQLVGAALTMVTLVAAFVTFFLDKRRPGIGFTILALIAVSLFIAGIVIGGKGIANVYREVATGTWEPQHSRRAFNLQAWATILAIGFAISLAFSGGRQTRDTERAIDSLRSTQQTQSEQLGVLENRTRTLALRADSLLTIVDRCRKGRRC